jgi:hypothetical protein
MKAITKDADKEKEFSHTKSGDSSIQRLRDESEGQIGSLRGVIGDIRRNGDKPSVESIATGLSGMPTGERATALLALQQTHGNQYVQRVVSGIQAKLVVGQAGDIYEREADRVAEEVVRMPEPMVKRQVGEEEENLIQSKPLVDRITPMVQRPAEEEEKGEEFLQTKAHSSQVTEVTSNIESRIQYLQGGGQPLSKSERTFFEPRFGNDFSQVRVHTDSNAIQMSRELNAQAFTHGSNIYFGTGRYNPGTSSGKKLLAHELTHVVQQKADSGFIENFSIQRSNSHHPTPAAGSTSQQASSVQRPNIQNCSFRQFALVHMGIGDARRLANEALRAISGYRPQVQNKAQIHFGQPLGPSEYNTIIQRYRHILSTLDSKTYICDACTPSSLSELGIQPPNPDHLPCAQGECPGSRIIICPPFGTPPNCPPPGQTIIHEAAHNSGACLDINRRPGQYPPAPSDGINNAYSYEYFAADVSP